jgi:hypothetical protein
MGLFAAFVKKMGTVKGLSLDIETPERFSWEDAELPAVVTVHGGREVAFVESVELELSRSVQRNGESKSTWGTSVEIGRQVHPGEDVVLELALPLQPDEDEARRQAEGDPVARAAQRFLSSHAEPRRGKHALRVKVHLQGTVRVAANTATTTAV